MSTLHGQVALVTGAGSGVGQAIACALAAEGATVCLVGRTPATLDATASDIHQARGAARCYPADLTQDDAVQALAERLQHEWEAIDILVHCAGIFAMGRIESAPVADLERQYRTHVHAPYLLTQALLPSLRQRQGQVVFINSLVVVTPGGGVGAYATTKHALIGLANSLREEVNAEGLRVLTVYIGSTASPMQAMIHARRDRAYHPEHFLQPSDVASVVLNALCLPYTAEVTDISIRPRRKPA